MGPVLQKFAQNRIFFLIILKNYLLNLNFVILYIPQDMLRIRKTQDLNVGKQVWTAVHQYKVHASLSLL